MIEAGTLADRLGRKEIAKAVSVSVHAVNIAVHRGKFPSSWYFTLKALADKSGAECPVELFTFKSPEQSHEVAK